jgi:hypothetical protein
MPVCLHRSRRDVPLDALTTPWLHAAVRVLVLSPFPGALTFRQGSVRWEGFTS